MEEVKIVPKVTWKREEGGGAVPYMYECIDSKKNLWKWRRYNISNVYVSDGGSGFSKGYKSWIAATNAGYIPVDPKKICSDFSRT